MNRKPDVILRELKISGQTPEIKQIQAEVTNFLDARDALQKSIITEKK